MSLAGSATREEEHALDAALRAWEGALPGPRLLHTGAGSIRVRFVDAPVARADGTLGTGRTVADCRLDLERGDARAALAAASIEVARRTTRSAPTPRPRAAPACARSRASPSRAHRSPPSTRALGERLARAEVERWRTFELDRLAKLARARRLDGPYLRAGDAVGGIFWRDARGREWGFLVPGLAQLARDPTQLLLLPEANTRGALLRRG